MCIVQTVTTHDTARRSDAPLRTGPRHSKFVTVKSLNYLFLDVSVQYTYTALHVTYICSNLTLQYYSRI